MGIVRGMCLGSKWKAKLEFGRMHQIYYNLVNICNVAREL